jgi:integration host factor subunit beta
MATKKNLIANLVTKLDYLSKDDAEIAVDTVVDIIKEQLSQKNRIEIRGFGSWYVKEYKSYTGRNPKTGSTVKVGEKKLPFFKVGKELKKRIDDSKKGPIKG